MKKASPDKAPSNQDKETITLIDSIADPGPTKASKTASCRTSSYRSAALTMSPTMKREGYLELGEARKMRTLTVNTARSFAQTLRLMAASRTMVESNDFATKREAYYISKNWGDCRFDEQAESDAIMDDIEAMASLHGLSREQLRFYPESHGGSVAGRLTVIDRNPATGRPIEIDCANLGSGAYSIPRSVEHLELPHRRPLRARHRNRRHVPAPQQSSLLGDGELHHRRDGRRADPRHPALRSPAFRQTRTCRSTALSIATRMASPISTARSRRARATPLMSTASSACRGRVSSASRRRTSSTSASRTRRTRWRRPTSSARRTRCTTTRSSRPIPHGSPRSSNCWKWGFAPSSRRWPNGASITLSTNICLENSRTKVVFCRELSYELSSRPKMDVGSNPAGSH